MSVEVNATNFPDENFRNFILGYSYIMNPSTTLLTDANIAKCKTLSVAGKGIGNLKGIEYFTALEWLMCEYNQLTSIDLSKNKALRDLSCHDNPLTSLNVSQNTSLETLECANCKLTKLDVSKNSQLKRLYCWTNYLTTLDVSKNVNLENLDCHENMLSTLDLSKNTKLKSTWLDPQWIYPNLDIETELTDEGDEYCFTTKFDMKKIVGAANISRVSIPESWGYKCENGVIIHSGRIRKDRIDLYASDVYGENGSTPLEKSEKGYYHPKKSQPSGVAPLQNFNLYYYNYDTGSSHVLQVTVVVNAYMLIAILPKVKTGEQCNIPIALNKITNMNGTRFPNIYMPSHQAIDIPTTPLKFSIVSGSLPPGLTLNENTGVISGTPK